MAADRKPAVCQKVAYAQFQSWFTRKRVNGLRRKLVHRSIRALNEYRLLETVLLLLEIKWRVSQNPVLGFGPPALMRFRT